MKLTLNIDSDIIRKSKRYVKSNNQTLSGLIESYLRVLINRGKPDEKSFSPIVKSLKGSARRMKRHGYKKTLQEQLRKKYSG